MHPFRLRASEKKRGLQVSLRPQGPLTHVFGLEIDALDGEGNKTTICFATGIW